MRLRRLGVAACCAVAATSLLGVNAQAAASKEGLQLVATRDSVLATHQWYVQTFAGKPVLDTYYVKHVDKATGQVTVDDGQIWSRALFDVFKSFGRDKSAKIVLESRFSYAPSTSFASAAKATVEAARKLYGDADAATVKQAFVARGIL